MTVLAAPEPMVTSLPPDPAMACSPLSSSIATLPMVVRAVIFTLDCLLRLRRIEPISQRTLLVPESMQPLAVTLPACATTLIGPRKSLTLQLPACTSAVMGPWTPSTRKLPACTLATSGRSGFMRTFRPRRVLKSKPLISMRRPAMPNVNVSSSWKGTCSITIVLPSRRTRWGPSATAVATVGSATTSALPNWETTLTEAAFGAGCKAAGAGRSRVAVPAAFSDASSSSRAAPSSAVMVPVRTWFRI